MSTLTLTQLPLTPYELYQEYPLIEMGHTIQPPPPGALVRVSATYCDKVKNAAYGVAKHWDAREYGNGVKTVELIGAEVFSTIDVLLKRGKELVLLPNSVNAFFQVSTTTNTDLPSGPVQTVAILANDFFEYLKTAKRPLVEQFPPAEDFTIPNGLGINWDFYRRERLGYELNQSYDLDDFVHNYKWPPKGAVIMTKQDQKNGTTSVRNIVFERFRTFAVPMPCGRVVAQVVEGLPIAQKPSPTDLLKLTVCGIRFTGRDLVVNTNKRELKKRQPLACKITVLAENYFAKPEGATPSQEPTEIKA